MLKRVASSVYDHRTAIATWVWQRVIVDGIVLALVNYK